MRTTLAIDPGLRCAGWAFFSGDDLVTCGLARRRKRGGAARGPVQWLAILHALRNAVNDRRVDHLVVEQMVIRTNGIPPADLMELQAIAGAVVGGFPAVRVDCPKPEQWKGNVPKKIHQPRILKKLTPSERAMVEAITPESLRHNAIDAVGIGLWAVGRMTPGRYGR